jgi:hypothetical protein
VDSITAGGFLPCLVQNLIGIWAFGDQNRQNAAALTAMMTSSFLVKLHEPRSMLVCGTYFIPIEYLLDIYYGLTPLNGG